MASTIKVDKIEGSTGSTVTVPTGQTLTVTDGLAIGSIPTITVAKGGTNTTSYTTGDTVYASGATAISKLGIGTARQGLQTNSGASAPEWVDSPQSLMTAAGDILYASGANTLAKLAKGSDDEVLTLASGVPSWASAAGGGAWTKISNQNASGESEIEFNTFSADYRDFRVVVSDWVHSSDQNLYFRISDASGYETANYKYTFLGSYTATTFVQGSESATAIYLNYNTPDMGSGSSISGIFNLFDVHDTSNLATADYRTWYFRTDGQINTLHGSGSHTNTAATTGVRFYGDSGTIDSGSFTLYGRKIT